MINKGKKYQAIIYLLIGLFVIGLIYCGVLVSKHNNTYSGGVNQKQDSETLEEESTRSFIGVVKSLDHETQNISILGVENPVVTNLRYTGGTDIKNQYGKVISMKAISLGEIVSFTYNFNTNKLLSLQIYKDAWTYENVKKMKMDQGRQVMQLGSSRYGFTDSLLYVGDNEIIGLSDLSEKDQLTIKGIGDTVYSIIVTKGHGVMRFINFEDFVGGTVYIGSSTYLRVQDKMNVVMREGTYKLTMQNGNLIGTKEVTVERGKEVTVDMGEFHLEKAQVGEITFHISPYGADLSVNGTETDYSHPVVLNYGTHKINVTLNGYKSFSGLLTVGQSEQVIEVNLVPDTSDEDSTGGDNVTTDPSDDDDDIGDVVLDWDSDSTDEANNNTSASPTTSSKPTTSASPSSSPSSSPSASPENEIDTDHKITVSAPVDVEVYLDDAYKGIAPISFTKVLGSHKITLKKEGYVTKEYTIHVENDKDNVFYTFSELEKEKE